MSRIVVCLDCPIYQKGGYCPHKRKDVSALQEACEHAKTMNLTFNPEDKEDDMTLKEKYGSDLAEIIEGTPTKVCSKCGETKPLTDFYKDKKASDGHQSWCKRCVSADNAQRARKALAEKRAAKDTTKTDKQPKKVVVRETLTDKQMVELLREHGWTVTCYRTITEEL